MLCGNITQGLRKEEDCSLEIKALQFFLPVMKTILFLVLLRKKSVGLNRRLYFELITLYYCIYSICVTSSGGLVDLACNGQLALTFTNHKHLSALLSFYHK